MPVLSVLQMLFSFLSFTQLSLWHLYIRIFSHLLLEQCQPKGQKGHISFENKPATLILHCFHDSTGATITETIFRPAYLRS